MRMPLSVIIYITFDKLRTGLCGLIFGQREHQEMLPGQKAVGFVQRITGGFKLCEYCLEFGEVAERAFPEIDDRDASTGLEVAGGIFEIVGTVFQMVIRVDRKNEIHLLRNQRVVLHRQDGLHVFHLLSDRLLVNTGVHLFVDVDRVNLAGGTHRFRQPEGEVTGAGAEVCHLHARFQLKSFDHPFGILPGVAVRLLVTKVCAPLRTQLLVLVSDRMGGWPVEHTASRQRQRPQQQNRPNAARPMNVERVFA